MRSTACSSDRLRARLAGLEWRLIEDGAAPGAWNMAVDTALLEAARRDLTPPTLRLYGWSRPTLSLGRHQDLRAGIDHAFRHRRGIDLVRRPTGGRAVLHDQEVTYSIVLPAALGRGAGVGEVYRNLSGALLAGLSELLPPGVHASDNCQWPIDYLQLNIDKRRLPGLASCFATAAGGDGLTGAGKLVGSAQARRGGAVLQHGSVLLDLRRGDWEGLFGDRGLEVAFGALVSPAPAEATVRAALRRGLARELQVCLVTGALTASERERAECLVAEQ